MKYVIYCFIIGQLLMVRPIFGDDSTSAGIPPIGNIECTSQMALNVVQSAVWTGQYSISVDGLGTLGDAGYIQVQKPVGATVQAAYLIAAAMWGRALPDGSIAIEGNAINWDETYFGAGGTENGWADVTSIVAPLVDAGSPGTIDILIAETNTDDLDGEALAVVFNDANITQTSSILFLFGGQAVAGEYFDINLAEPVDLSNPDFHIYMGLGISYSAQYANAQYSLVDVNNVRLSTAAGGMDDGAQSNGALLTVGGIGDNYSNPADPYDLPDDDLDDDELYDLTPFMNDGDDYIQVYTRNPSNDDNIFFAWIESTISAALGESAILTLSATEAAVHSDVIVSVALNLSNGDPIANTSVEFRNIGGVNKGNSFHATSDANGHAQWIWSSPYVGIDSIQASYYSTSLNDTVRSNIGVINWTSMADANFQLRINPETMVLSPGQSGQSQIELDTTNGFSDTVDLSCSNAPAGIDVEFNPQSIQYPDVSQCDVHVATSASAGTHHLIIQGQSGRLTHTDTLTVLIQNANPVPIYPAMVASQVAGCDFWVDVHIGEPGNEVADLYGASFIVTFDSNYLTPDSSGITPGSFIGSPAMHFVGPIHSGDSLFLSVTRTNTPGMNGWGSVLRIPFELDTTAPDTQLCIQILDAQANDPNWNPIPLAARDSCIQVVPWVVVWPGDTDNNGYVDQSDLLPIGLSWGKTGYARDYPNLYEWTGQPCRPWEEDVRCTYADANGDSTVNQNDILAISSNYNWHRTHHSHARQSSAFRPVSFRKGGCVYLEARKISGIQYDVNVCLREAEDVLSVGVALTYPERVKVLSVKAGGFWNSRPLSLHHDDANDNTLGIGIGQIREDGGVSGRGCITTIRFDAPSEEHIYGIGISEVSGIDASSTLLTFDVESFTQAAPDHGNAVPGYYAFRPNYPNPFNPATTLSFELPVQSLVRITVFDVLGNEVIRLLNSQKEAGRHVIEWDGRNRSGEQVSSGVYYFRFEAGDFVRVQKGLLMR